MQLHRTCARSGPSALICTVTALLALASMPGRADEFGDVQQLLKSGNTSGALQRADQFLASHPKDAQMRFLKGVALAEQSRSGDAVTTFVKLTEDYPELPEPYNNLAVLYANQGQYDKARTALEMAIRTNPSYATAYENLGDVYAKLASQAYSKALQVDAGNSAVAPKLALIKDLFAPARGNDHVAAAARASQAADKTVAGVRPITTAPSTALAATTAAPMSAGGTSGAFASTLTTPPPSTVSTAATTQTAKPLPIAAASTAGAATVAMAAATAKAPPAGSTKPAAAAATTVSPEMQADINAAVQAWAQAWSHKDIDSYFAAYTSAFSPGTSRSAWQDERRAKIMGKSNIKVNIADLTVSVSGDRATARFRQMYLADNLSVNSRKTLSLIKTDGKWLIERESVGS